MTRLPVIAIDGPAASGKGTIARRIAAGLGFAHLDTGLLYRAVGVAVMQAGGDPADPKAAERAAASLDLSRLEDPALRTDLAGSAASKVAAIPAVRASLLAFQRRFALAPPGGRGAVLDGRDIATVNCPDADVKLFVTASVDARTQRRLAELRTRGEAIEFDQLKAQIAERDQRDMNRAEAPLRQSEGAFLLDTTDLTVEQSVAAAIAIIERARGG
jgi:cytidylate kinase